MRLWRTTALLALVSRSAQLTSKDSTDTPMCAIQCWENSKYVGSCVDDDCLCIETSYQKAIFPCLYAQCDSTLFGTAFLHTITRCAELGIGLYIATPPPILGHDELRRREAEYVAGLTSTYGPVSGCGYSAQSMNIFPTDSAGSYPTQSAANGYTSATNAAAAEPPLTSQGTGPFSNAATSIMISAAAHVSSLHGLGVSATATGLFVYTSMGFHSGRSSIGPILVALINLYLTV